MKKFNTIHIFWYGETQIIVKNLNKKVLTSSLFNVQAVIDNIYSKKPNDNNASSNYFSINIFEGLFADFTPNNNSEKYFRLKYTDLDLNLIYQLVDEIKALN